MRILVPLAIGVMMAVKAPWALAACTSGQRELTEYWRQALDELECFPPEYVMDQATGALTFWAWQGRRYQATFWAGQRDLLVLMCASAPKGWEPPDDGNKWLCVAPPRWSTRGLPDPHGYCVREHFLQMAQALRVVWEMGRRRIQCLVVAERFGAPAALAMALAEPAAVAGVVLVQPRPYEHLRDGRVCVGGEEGEALKCLISRHPEWADDLEQALAAYDIRVLAEAVKVPIVAVAPSAAPAWLRYAIRDWGWQLLTSDPTPALQRLVSMPWFGEMWSEALGLVERWQTVAMAGVP